jgi:transglutaminase-like putative cysteine protease
MSRLKPAEGWTSLILVTLMLLTLAWSIEAADWAPGLALLQGIVLGAVLVGWIFSELPIPGFIAHVLSTVAGLGWAAFLVGRQLEPTSITHRILLDETALTWRVRLMELFYRVRAFVEIMRTGGVGHDNLVFVLQMAVLIWLVGYASTWFLFQLRSIWGAIVPSGFAMLLNLYYAPPDLYVWMAVYLLCALLLIIRSNVFLQEWEWRQAGVMYSPDIGYDFLWHGTVFAIVVLVLAWVAPTTDAAPRLDAIVDRFNAPVYRFQREFNRLYSSLNYRPQPGPAYFGDSMALLGPVNLGDTPIFDAVTSKGRYWRGVVYDEYTGRGWVNTATSITNIAYDDPRLDAIKFELREPVTQTIRVLQPEMVQLHTLPQPIRVDLPARVEYSPIREAAGPDGVPLNVSIVQSRRPLKVGETYTAVSSVSVADVQSLRGAGTDYPDWVKEKYLQLPDDLPQRVRNLAAEITAGKDNPYDKVSALEAYLRKIKYDEKIPAPPPGVDGVDWFLFEERAGYCDYYASSLVIMARLLGIPARMAAGYSLGEYDPDIGAYRQREYDAHSWPEVFFPKYGWVEFEPTAADPRIARPSAPPPSASTANSSNDNQQRNDRLPDENLLEPQIGGGASLAGLGRHNITLWVWGALGLLGMLLLFALAGWLLWRRAYQGLSLASATYARMLRFAAWLGQPAEPSQTPHEYAGQLASAIPEGGPAIGRIADIYVLERFAEVPPDEVEASALQEAWLSLRRVLLEHIGIRWLRRITGGLGEGGDE